MRRPPQGLLPRAEGPREGPDRVARRGRAACAQRKVMVRVTYQDACHLAHAQRIKKQPRDLIRAVDGIEFVEMRHADICCGAAGLYSTLEPDMSQRILDQKLEDVLATKAEVVTVANPGCQMQLEAGLRARGSNMKVEHVAETLMRAF